MPRPLAIALFAGAGGMTLGFKMVGYRVLLALETDADACRTYSLNHPDVRVINDSVAAVTLDGISGELRKCKGKPSVTDIDVVFGGPPCQGFSIIGRRDVNDYRNKGIKYFVDAITEIKPKAFVMENVFGLLSFLNGSFVQQIRQAFEDIGYLVTQPEILNARDYGVPQNRKRAFLLGIRSDISGWAPPYPVREHWRGKLWDVISDLPSEAVSVGETTSYVPMSENCLTFYQQVLRQGAPTSVHNHHTKGMEELRKARVKALQEGQTRVDLPPELQSGGLPNKYRRLHSEWPMIPTLTAHMGKDLSDFIHPKHNRWITVREAARFQSFPDRYVFVGSVSSQLRQVGNAVPPILASYLAYQLGIYLGLKVHWWKKTALFGGS